jgi:hypothetical protein
VQWFHDVPVPRVSPEHVLRRDTICISEWQRFGLLIIRYGQVTGVHLDELARLWNERPVEQTKAIRPTEEGDVTPGALFLSSNHCATASLYPSNSLRQTTVGQKLESLKNLTLHGDPLLLRAQ